MKTIEIPGIISGDPVVTVEMEFTGIDLEWRSTYRYMVREDGVDKLARNGRSDFRSGVGGRPDEERAVRTLCSFLGAAGESLWMHQIGYSPGASEYANEYNADEQRFLIDHYERFNAYSAED